MTDNQRGPQHDFNSEPTEESSESSVNGRKLKTTLPWLSLSITLVAVVLGVTLHIADSPWCGIAYFIAMLCGINIVVWLSGGIKFELFAREEGSKAGESQWFAAIQQQIGHWIARRVAHTPLSPGRKLLVMAGIYVGGAAVLVPVCSSCLPSEWPYRTLTGWVAALGLVVLDVYILAPSKKWPTAILCTRTYLEGVMGGAALATFWVVSVGLLAAVFIGISESGRQEDRDRRGRFGPNHFSMPKDLKERIARRKADSTTKTELDMGQVASHFDAVVRKSVSREATREYWLATVCPLLETPLFPEPSPGESVGQFFERGASSTWLHEVEEAAKDTNDVDQDLVVLVRQHLEEHRKALQKLHDAFAPAVRRHAERSMKDAAERSKNELERLAAHYDQPVEIDTSLIDLLMADSERSGNDEQRCALAEILAAQDVFVRQTCEACELRGRLRERYSCQGFPMPWEEQYETESQSVPAEPAGGVDVRRAIEAIRNRPIPSVTLSDALRHLAAPDVTDTIPPLPGEKDSLPSSLQSLDADAVVPPSEIGSAER